MIMKRIIPLMIFLHCGVLLMAQKDLVIAGLQMNVSRSIRENEYTIIQHLNSLNDKDVDFLITPEGSLSGYNSEFDGEELKEALARVVAAARNAGVGLILGTCFKDSINGREYCYNQARIYLPDGTFKGAYSKILTCSPLDNPGTGEIMEYVSGEVITFTVKDIGVGILICNDLWATPGYTTTPNPYLPWKMKEAGAEIIFHIINSGTDMTYRTFHEASVELWAKTLELPIVEVNAAHGNDEINAGSGIVNKDGKRMKAVLNKGEQLFIHDIILE